ncbi:PQQ-binding-like beta-propeller repeat protein [Spirochaeta africana]|uniref:WD40-like repeat protein n=1 Tax=Spirochaeta africana (strain ATCC 700263 / DSM 8902 / Z-7692) TaxID=889378 RepID=H9UK04_SPIAZ|nr:PQQ-binding-like beta-propeller repeat protein [Spirochaeta africana]AFG37847.1 WD40-like repeat protein [Spirochaeta africana DSM 8902]
MTKLIQFCATMLALIFLGGCSFTNPSDTHHRMQLQLDRSAISNLGGDQLPMQADLLLEGNIVFEGEQDGIPLFYTRSSGLIQRYRGAITPDNPASHTLGFNRVIAGRSYQIVVQIDAGEENDAPEDAVLVGISDPVSVSPGQQTTVSIELDWMIPVSFTPEPAVYAGGFDNTVRSIDASGNQIWVFEGHTDDVRNITADADGYVYSSSRDETVRKITPEGQEAWSFDVGGDAMSVAVDSMGNVYTASGFGGVLHKISPSGDLIWIYEDLNTGSFQNHVAVDRDDNLYVGGGNGRVYRIHPDGPDAPEDTILWNSYIGSGNTIWTIDVDDMYVYAGQYSTLAGAGGTVSKLDLEQGALEWTETTFRTQTVFADNLGNVYVAESAGEPTDGILRKIDSDGDTVWTYEYLPSLYSVAVNTDGMIYFSPWSPHFYKLDADREEQWRFNDVTGAVRTLALPPGLRN